MTIDCDVQDTAGIVRTCRQTMQRRWQECLTLADSFSVASVRLRLLRGASEGASMLLSDACFLFGAMLTCDALHSHTLVRLKSSGIICPWARKLG